MDMSSDMIGKIVDGKYEIKKRLGGGAFGDVYLANELLNGSMVRRVALKILKTDSMDEQKLREQFNDCTFPALILDRSVDFESKKHFVQIFSWGFTEIDYREKAYISMELVADSESLRDVLERQKKSDFLPDAKAVEDFARQLLKGLALAHGFNVIHRDLKPENLMISHDVVRIVDFGLGMELAGKAGFLGGHAGTIEYMAPENFIGYYNLASDVYAAGLIIYELWTNYHPFMYLTNQMGGRSQDNITMLYEARKRWKYRRGEDINPQVGASDKLNHIISNCLALNVADRYQSAGEVLEDLENYKSASDRDCDAGLIEFQRGDWAAASNLLAASNSHYDKRDEKKLILLEKLGFALKNSGKPTEALIYLLEAYMLDEERLLLTRELDRRGKLLEAVSECYESLGQVNMGRIYRRKIGTYSGQGK